MRFIILAREGEKSFHGRNKVLTFFLAGVGADATGDLIAFENHLPDLMRPCR